MSVSAAVLAIVVMHGLAYRFTGAPGPAALGVDLPTTIAVGASLAGYAGIIGGFGSVVAVFGLSRDSDRFSRLRAIAGSGLKANWIAPTAGAYGAALVALIAIALAGKHDSASWWLYEWALLESVHAGLRLIWLLRLLLRVVDADDKAGLSRKPAELTQAVPATREVKSA